jgi:ceramide glucosyltransferase
MSLAVWALAFCALAAALHFASIILAATRCFAGARPVPPPPGAPPVTIVRPLCGVDNFVEETLASTFRLDYPEYEINFCLARADDPVAPIVRRLMAAYPEVSAHLLIGADTTSPNPKLNNLIKGWDAARHDWIILTDSNVMLAPDYIQRMQAPWCGDRGRGDTGLVCSVPIASRPANFWAELECAFLNTFEARWEYAADTLGNGFAQGKNMLFRRDIVEAGGGIRALGAEMAEDAAATRLVRDAGLRVRLVDNPFEQPLGPRGGTEVWRRQLRWARLRRMTFPLYFLPELLPGIVPPLLAGIYAAMALGFSAWVFAMLLAIPWYGAELALARRAGWHSSWRMPAAFVLRDLLIPALWVGAWIGDSFAWRGTAMGGGIAAAKKIAG